MQDSLDAWVAGPDAASWLALCVAAALAALGGVYRALLGQVVANARRRERERIARELHDTVLQRYDGSNELQSWFVLRPLSYQFVANDT